MARGACRSVVFRDAVSSHHTFRTGNGDAMELKPSASPFRAKILAYLRRHPNATLHEIAAGIKCHRDTVCKNLTVLKRANLIKVHSGQFHGRASTYEVLT